MYNLNLKSERVTLQLEVGQIVYIPGAADLRKEVLASATVTLTKLTEKEHIIVEYIERYGAVSMGEATKICNYKTKSATRKIITELLKKEIIEKQGNGPSTRYVLTKKEI